MPLTGYLRDDEGYLVEPEDWTPEFARTVAADLGIELGPEHWDAIEFMRGYQEQHLVTPDVRYVTRHLSKKNGTGRNRIFELFPYGYVEQACKIAGMKRPRAWSTG
jgi:tRNA 2-thiouridine synthesizing protein E